jgi:hypothetical protein
MKRGLPPKGDAYDRIPRKVFYFVEKGTESLQRHEVPRGFCVGTVFRPRADRAGLRAGFGDLNVKERGQSPEKFRLLSDNLVRFMGGGKAGVHKIA